MAKFSPDLSEGNYGDTIFSNKFPSAFSACPVAYLLAEKFAGGVDLADSLWQAPSETPRCEQTTKPEMCEETNVNKNLLKLYVGKARLSGMQGTDPLMQSYAVSKSL